MLTLVSVAHTGMIALRIPVPIPLTARATTCQRIALTSSS